jgi:hypothetical protein
MTIVLHVERKGLGRNKMTKDRKHDPSLSAEDIAKIIREDMEEDDAGLAQRGYSYEVQQIEGRDNV